MIRGAAVYRRSGQWLLACESRTVDEFWIHTSPFVDAGPDPGDYVLGRLLSCLVELSIDGVETPHRDADLVSPLLRMAGVKSYGAFMGGGTVSVFVKEELGRFTLTPTRNAGASCGFHHLPESASSFDSPSYEELGAAVRAAIDLAQSES